MRVVLFSLLTVVFTAPLFALDVVNTSWTVVCLFSPTCSVGVTDHVSEFALSGGSGNGRLQSRIYQGQSGSAAAGKWVYEYRIDLSPVAGLTLPPYVDTMAVESWGAIREYDYDSNGVATDDVYNVTSGGLGSKAVTGAFLNLHWTFFELDNPVYAGSYPGGGESSYFFGLVSDSAPVLRTVWLNTDTGWITVQGYAPPLP
jgi:hypothetical protein